MLVKPPPGTPVDWGSPLSRGLQIAIPFNGTAHNPAGPSTLSLAAPSWIGSPIGTALACDGASTEGVFSNSDWYKNRTGWVTSMTLLMRVPTSGQTAFGRVLELGAGAGTFILNWQAGDGTLRLATTAYGDNIPWPSDYLWHAMTVRIAPDYSLSTWIDGAQVLSWSPGIPSSTGPDGLYFAQYGGGGYRGKQDIGLLLWHDRMLSDAEVKSLHGDPFQVFARTGMNRARYPAAPSATVSFAASPSLSSQMAVTAGSARRLGKPRAIDWSGTWTADATIAGVPMAHGGSIQGDTIDLSSEAAVEIGIKVDKTAGGGTLSVILLNSTDDSNYESPDAAKNRAEIALLADAGEARYRVQFDARSLSQAKIRLEVKIGDNGLFNARPASIASATVSYRTGVEA